jgi:plasmid stabilization system protein ParE
MHAFFQDLTSVFPWSLDAQQFQAPAYRQRIQEALQSLAQHAEQFDTHGQQVPQSFGFLRRSLARSARDTAERYVQGEYAQARFLLQGLTEQCFACHSRLPNLQPFTLGQRFLMATNVASLPVPQRLKLEVATRQFATAITTCEALLRSPDIPAADIWLMGVFENYLKLSIRVQNDFPRALTVLSQFLERPDVPAMLRDQLLSWVNALSELQASGPVDDALARSRTLIETGQRRNRFPADYQGFVHFVVASGLLHRWLSTPPAETRALAEAYYLLGIAETYIARTSRISEAPFFLEMAIRLDPTSAVAAQANDVLNTYILTEYTGSLGTRVPSEMQEHLDELRRLRGGS